MNVAAQLGADKNSEAIYRRAFIDGADSTITGLRARLSEDDVRALRAWMRELAKWRASGSGEPRGVPAFPRLDPPLPVDPRP